METTKVNRCFCLANGSASIPGLAFPPPAEVLLWMHISDHPSGNTTQMNGSDRFTFNILIACRIREGSVPSFPDGSSSAGEGLMLWDQQGLWYGRSDARHNLHVLKYKPTVLAVARVVRGPEHSHHGTRLGHAAPSDR
jgi:hypothetical protein